MSELTKYPLWHPFTHMSEYRKEPLVFELAEGSLIRDVGGRSYVNSVAGLWNLSLGSGNREIADAIHEQLLELSYASLFRMGHSAAASYAEELVAVLPGKVDHVFLTSNGSESVETMIKVARHYQRARGHEHKTEIICLERAYHGVSYGALSASGFPEDQEMYQPLLPGFHHVAAPYCLRCPFGEHPQTCADQCSGQVEETIQARGEDRIAGLLMEPVLGFGGVIVPPDRYFENLKRILNRHDILLMLDEVTTGFGRTGTMFAAEHWQLQPDMMAMGKAISGGYQPLGAAAFTEEIFSAFQGSAYEARLNHGSTNSGHPAACAAGRAVLAIYEREGVVGQAHALGEALSVAFARLRDNPRVAEVRQLGPLVGVELVSDPESLMPLSSEHMDGVVRALLRWGILAHLSGNNLIFVPPLVLPLAQAERLASGLELALSSLMTGETDDR